MKPHTLFEIEDFQRDDLTIKVKIEGRGTTIDIGVKDYENWLKKTDRLSIFDHTGKIWAYMNPEAYWERSEFFLCDDIYMYIVSNFDFYERISKA
jgi:hypothetical protein